MSNYNQIVRVPLYKELIMKSVRLFSLFVSVAFVHGLLGMEVEDKKLIRLGAGRIPTHMSKRSGQVVGDLSPGGMKTIANYFPEELQVKITQHLMKNHPMIAIILRCIELEPEQVMLERSSRSMANPFSTKSPDNSKKIIASLDGTAEEILDANTEECLCTLEGNSGGLWFVSWSPDSSRVISGAHNCKPTIWDTDTGARLCTLEEESNNVHTLRWSPDGSKVLAGCRDEAKIFNADTGACLHTVAQPYFESTVWSQDGSKVFTRSEDRTKSKIWDISKLIDVENSFNNQTLEQALLLDIIYKKAIAKKKKLALSHGEAELFHTLLPEVQHALRSHVILRSHATDSACTII